MSTDLGEAPTVPGPHGVASHPLAGQRERALAAWDAFCTLAAHADPEAPSRLRGWSGRDVVAHLASWPDAPLLARVLAEARGTAAPADRPIDQDTVNAAVVAAHRDAGPDDLDAALADGRARLAAAYDAVAGNPALGLAMTGSQVGPIPLLTQLGAVAYELAVHALDLAPCGAPEPPLPLLDAGLLALADITGALAARQHLDARATLTAPGTAWTFTSRANGTWDVAAENPAGRRGPAVQAASAALLVDASAGRRAVPALLARRDMRLRQVPGLLRLAPLLDQVPGLPGGPALRLAAGMLGKVTWVLPPVLR